MRLSLFWFRRIMKNNIACLKAAFLSCALAAAVCFSSCSGGPAAVEKTGDAFDAGNGIDSAGQTADADSTGAAADLKEISVDKPEYATGFSIKKYEGGYAELDVTDGREYFVVPEGADVPDGISASKIIIRAPLEKVYVASSSSMCRFIDTGSMDRVACSGLRQDEWKLAEAAEAMASGQIAYTGKYSAPDYETLLTGGCDLAVENLMILHKPEVIEKLEDLGIPVFIDRASGEEEPLGRTEWIKAYGLLLGKEEEAAAAFDAQKKMYIEAESLPTAGKSVACFYINSQGLVVCPRPDSSMAKMIAAAGGVYLYPEVQTDGSRLSTMKVDMESYMAAAGEADVIIYDGAIDTVSSLADIVGKNAQLKDFKAVQENNVYISGSDAYQNSDDTGTTVHDLYLTINGQEGAEHIRKAE